MPLVVAYDVDRKPGDFVRGRASDDFRVALVFLVLVVSVCFVSAALLLTGAAGAAAAVGLLFVTFAAKRFFENRLDSGINWGKGGNAEAAVGTDLESLRVDGYIVMHDLEHVVPGNVDHLISGPTGAFMIETKFKSYKDSDIPKAKRVAQTIAHQLEASWVQPVICVATRSYGPRMVNGVAVVGRQQLLPYVRAQTNRPVPFERLAAFADRQ